MIFLLAHIAVLLWAAFVVYVAAVTNEAALIGVFFLPAFGIDLLDRIPMFHRARESAKAPIGHPAVPMPQRRRMLIEGARHETHHARAGR